MNQLGVYYPTGSIWQRCDPRSKVALIIAVMVWLLFAEGWWSLLPFGLIVGLFISAKLSLNLGVKLLLKFKWLLLIVLIANLVVPQANLDWNNWLSHLTPAFAVTLRLAGMLLLAAWFSWVTRPLALVEALVSLLKPFGIVRIFKLDLPLMIMLVLRFIPEIMAESENIMIAQRIRGIKPKLHWKQSRFWIQSTIIPIFIASLRKASALAMALVARGYRIGGVRSPFEILQLTWFDYLIFIFAILLVILKFII